MEPFKYIYTKLRQTIVIRSVVTMFYFEFNRDYAFRGEDHDFWELYYVDKGEVEAWAGDERHTLPAGSMICLKPNEYHRFYAGSGKAPNVIVITFECRSPAMKALENKALALDDEGRNRLASIVEAGMEAFGFPFQYPLKRRPDAPEGSEQLIRLHLELLLLQLVRGLRAAAGDEVGAEGLSKTGRDHADSEVVRLVVVYLGQRLHENVTLAEISETLLISKTRLKDVFKARTGDTVMEYFAKRKIERAKQLIREYDSTFTQIAGALGYSSVHAFSKTFKRLSGMTPSEYARSVKARLKRER